MREGQEQALPFVSNFGTWRVQGQGQSRSLLTGGGAADIDKAPVRGTAHAGGFAPAGRLPACLPTCRQCVHMV